MKVTVMHLLKSNPWIELKRTDFLDALKKIKPSLRVKGAPERELQIGLINGKAVFSVEGASASINAIGVWPGIASLRLAYFLTFLIAKPTEVTIRITYENKKISLSSARFPAEWIESSDLFTSEQIEKHTQSQTKEKTLKFKCPICKKKQGMPVDSLPRGAFAAENLVKLKNIAELNEHGFACTACGSTWAEQEA
jgi:hypothetical protein